MEIRLGNVMDVVRRTSMCNIETLESTLDLKWVDDTYSTN